MKTIPIILLSFMAASSCDGMGWKPKPTPTPSPTVAPTVTPSPLPSPLPTPTGTPGSQKPYLAGNIALLESDKQDRPLDLNKYAPIWPLSFVDGVRYRGEWANVEQAEGHYNFSKIDALVALCKANPGKFMSISVAGGFTAPDWLKAKVPTIAIHDDRNPTEVIGTLPIFWNNTYQTAAVKLIRALKARYEHEAVVREVIVTFFMQDNGMYVCGLTDEPELDRLAKADGHTDFHSAYQKAAKFFVDMWLQEFATTNAEITFVRPFASDKGRDDGDYVKNYIINTYPGRGGVMVSSVFACVPEDMPPKGAVAPHPKGGQSFWWAAHKPGEPVKPDQNIYKQRNSPSPYPDDPEPLRAMLENSVLLGNQKHEHYLPDLLQAAAKPILIEYQTKLKANVP